jgi:hypothetical protein
VGPTKWPRVPAQERRAENRARACDFAIFCIDSEIFGAPTDSTGSIAHAEGASTAIVVRCANGPAQSVLANTQDLDAFAHVFCAPTVCPGACACADAASADRLLDDASAHVQRSAAMAALPSRKVACSVANLFAARV